MLKKKQEWPKRPKKQKLKVNCRLVFWLMKIDFINCQNLLDNQYLILKSLWNRCSYLLKNIFDSCQKITYVHFSIHSMKFLLFNININLKKVITWNGFLQDSNTILDNNLSKLTYANLYSGHKSVVNGIVVKNWFTLLKGKRSHSRCTRNDNEKQFQKNDSEKNKKIPLVQSAWLVFYFVLIKIYVNFQTSTRLERRSIFSYKFQLYIHSFS